MLANKSGGSFDNSESIYAQVLRAEYYPPSDILKAGPKNGSSFICQSLVAAFNLLDASIFGIPSSPTRMVIDPCHGSWRSNFSHVCVHGIVSYYSHYVSIHAPN